MIIFSLCDNTYPPFLALRSSGYVIIQMRRRMSIWNSSYSFWARTFIFSGYVHLPRCKKIMGQIFEILTWGHSRGRGVVKTVQKWPFLPISRISFINFFLSCAWTIVNISHIKWCTTFFWANSGMVPPPGEGGLDIANFSKKNFENFFFSNFRKKMKKLIKKIFPWGGGGRGHSHFLKNFFDKIFFYQNSLTRLSNTLA